MVAIIGNEYTAQIIITMLKQWDDALWSLEFQQIIPFMSSAAPTMIYHRNSII